MEFVIIASCGHEIKNTPKASSWMEFDEDFTQDKIARVVSYGVLCPKCKKQYKKWGILLESKRAEQDWVDGKLEYPK